ncbi:hypothetical protein CAEBREN_06662 [Caenorhabditis brenneri]|uniref:Uncharacterized protein n=1 Tax=Caenorhabditis brenneri TaxID=135651 RepID=G0MHP6_CAEBE|nr:hypothetical protein CAEBREN_06662 [Caenorhabditis brenneri]
MDPKEMSIEDVQMLCQLLFEMTQFKTNIIDSLRAKIQNKEGLIIFLESVKDKLLCINQDQQKQIEHLKNEIATFEKNEGKYNKHHDINLQ